MPKKTQSIIWKYRNGDKVSYWLRFYTQENRPAVRRLTDKEVKALSESPEKIEKISKNDEQNN